VNNDLILRSNKFRQTKIEQNVDIKIETSANLLKGYFNNSLKSKFDYYNANQNPLIYLSRQNKSNQSPKKEGID